VRFQGGGVPGFDPPNFPVRFHAASRGGDNWNELSYASAKATEATAPKAAEASTAASRRVAGWSAWSLAPTRQ
jgi:hypothetical protein